jgi:tRNA (mo5U34)-methyltransferase
MSEMAPEEIKRRINEYQWYHTIDLGQGLVTPGQYDHRPLLKNYGLPDDLAGKTVLDVGPAHGFFAFEFEKRNAARVVTVELPRWSDHDGSPALKENIARDRTDVTGESYLHGALEFAMGACRSKIERKFLSIYEVSPETVGTFDLVFCGSLLIHLTDPLRALYAIRTVAREYAIIATPIFAAPIFTRWLDRSPVAQFQGAPYGQTFWAPNMLCLEKWALAAGFARVERVSKFHLKSVDGKFDTLHGTVKAFV